MKQESTQKLGGMRLEQLLETKTAQPPPSYKEDGRSEQPASIQSKVLCFQQGKRVGVGVLLGLIS